MYFKSINKLIFAADENASLRFFFFSSEKLYFEEKTFSIGLLTYFFPTVFKLPFFFSTMEKKGLFFSLIIVARHFTLFDGLQFTGDIAATD